MREVCMHQIKVFRQRLYLWSQDVKSLQFRGLHNMSNIGGQQDETIRGELQAKQGKNVEQISQDPKPKKERIDYFQVAEQNKRRIQQIKQYRASKNHNQLATEFPFSSKYLERLVSIKYYYADLVSIVGELIMQITGKSEGEINENFLVQRANIHFLLYVYHLYPKEFKGFKEEFVNILNVYLQAELGNSGALNSNSQEEVQRQRQFFVYLRTFLQSEFSALINHNRLNLEIVEEYFLLIKVKYKNEKTLLIQGKKNQSTDKNQKELEMIKLLRKYLIRLPNIWVGSKPKQHLQDQVRSSQNNESKDRETLRLSQIVLEVLDFFVEQFSHSFKREIDTWMDPNSTLTAIPKPLPNNFSYKNFYSQYFKSSQYRTRLNILEVGLHRLWQVIDEKQAKVTGNIGGQRDKERNQMGSGAFRRQLQKQWGAEIEYVRGRYNNKTINVVEYLPLSNTKMKEDDFLKLLILLKNIMTYHTLRELQPNQLTSYLERMFQTNEELILIPLPLTNPAAQKRRQIRLMIGELISKLSSGMWADEEEKLGRWVSISEVSKANKQKEKGRRNNRGEWVEVDT